MTAIQRIYVQGNSKVIGIWMLDVRDPADKRKGETTKLTLLGVMEFHCGLWTTFLFENRRQSRDIEPG